MNKEIYYTILYFLYRNYQKIFYKIMEDISPYIV